MLDEDTPDEGGLEPAPDDASSVAVETPEAPVEAPTFSLEDVASGLGSRFQERFLPHHEPAQAISEYAKSVEHLQSAYGRLSNGGEPTAEDYAAAEALGIDLPQYAEPEPEPVQPLWGAPWAEPTDYQSFVELANTRPDKAMEFIDKQPAGVIDPDVRQQVLNYWAEHDQAGAISYERAQARLQAIDEAKAYTDAQLAEYREQITPLQAGAEAAAAQAREAKLAHLGNLSLQRVPYFEQHREGVMEMLKQYADAYGLQYFDNLLALPVDEQVKHINGLTGMVAWQNRPAAEAAAAEESAQADAKKIAQTSARPAGGGAATGSGVSRAKQEHLASFQRLKDVEIPIR